MKSVGIIGGSGPLGRGLAGRFAQAGLAVALGSRDRGRAIDVAAAITDQLQRPDADLVGAANTEVLDRDVVLVTVPAEALDQALPPLAEGLRGRLVVSTVNPLGFDDAGPHAVRLLAGSAAAAIARHVPGARVTAALHTVSSHHLLRFDRPMDDDVPVVGDTDDDVAAVARLIDRVPGLRAVPAGPLRLAASLEDLTPILIAVNKRAKRHVGLRFTRLPDPPDPLADPPRAHG